MGDWEHGAGFDPQTINCDLVGVEAPLSGFAQDDGEGAGRCSTDVCGLVLVVVVVVVVLGTCHAVLLSVLVVVEGPLRRGCWGDVLGEQT